MKLKVKTTDVIKKENLFIDTNHPDYKWLKKHYNDADVSAGEREFVDFDDSFVNVSVGKHTLKYIAPNVFPDYPTETIAIVGKAKRKEFIADRLVHCRFMYDGPNTYEIIGLVDKDKTEFNKDGVIVFKKQNKL
jgi:hypothetical protein